MFDTPPLTERVEFNGAPEVELDLCVDKPVGQISVRLNDVAPDGASTRISLGLLNLTHRGGHEEPEPMEPGRRYRVRLVLDHMAYAFVPGHKMRIAIATGYWPVAWPAAEKTTLTLYSGGSVLRLPVREPRAEDDTLRAFEEPESTEPEPRIWLSDPVRKRSIHHDIETGVTTLEVNRSRGRYRIDSHGLELSVGGSERYSVKPQRPSERPRRIRADHVHVAGRLACQDRDAVDDDMLREGIRGPFGHRCVGRRRAGLQPRMGRGNSAGRGLTMVYERDAGGAGDTGSAAVNTGCRPTR